MRYFRLEPPRPGDAVDETDPAGGSGRTVFTWVYPSRDPILKDVRFFGVPAPFGERLRRRDLSGYSLVPTETRSGQTEVAVPVHRLIVDGRAAVDDFGLQTPTTLVVSERVVEEMRAYGVTECRFHDYDPSYRVPTPEELLQQLKERGRQ
jgi:hypothetical protein